MYDKGILHRDISFGNIIICDDDNDDTNDVGMLIDLDHSKYSAHKRAVPKHHVTDQSRQLHLNLLRETHSVDLDPSVLSKILEINPRDAVTYALEIAETRSKCFGNDDDATAVWNLNELYWPDEVGCPSSLYGFTDITMKV